MAGPTVMQAAQGQHGAAAASNDAQSEQRSLIEFAAKAAETFASAYYAATDSPQRLGLIPTLYLPNSTIVWNGTPVSGKDELVQLLAAMPGSKHELQAFDAHPVGGGTENGVRRAPSVMITVTGVVTHHIPGSASTMAPTNAPKSAGGSSIKDLPLEALPRTFHQSFLLTPQPTHGTNAPVPDGGVNCATGDGVWAARLFVQADNFRFIG
ncbi:NTF2-like protein [Ceraceosorus guamensis]|uniref:NTF2-like protein n=1 Tax=Ceraceosorus guamensis TaxID=1522189 RepID=A0A316W3C8_9BASI|nr:NTF2-like protein [Ceraceosorus guamensis]PWN44222.1 NTF2-like protein [Ceraceosorus guamensis]